MLLETELFVPSIS